MKKSQKRLLLKKVLDSGWGVCYNLQGYDGIKKNIPNKHMCGLTGWCQMVV